MVTEAILAWLHYLAIIMVFGAVTSQLYVLKLAPDLAALRLLGRIDRFYLGAALAVLITGALRIALGIKGWGWYMPNPMLHAKIGLFLLVGFISAVPTTRFVRWRKAIEAGSTVPPSAVRQTRHLIHLQLMLLSIIPLLAALLARGYGAAVR